MPELHVIGAGFLLELTLRNADFRIPVGRVSSLYLYLLSFKEFLQAYNPQALECVTTATLEKPVPEAIYMIEELSRLLSALN